MKQQDFEPLGLLIDSLENFTYSLNLPMPADFHVKQLKTALPDLVKDFKKLFVSLSGENPWQE